MKNKINVKAALLLAMMLVAIIIGYLIFGPLPRLG